MHAAGYATTKECTLGAGRLLLRFREYIVAGHQGILPTYLKVPYCCETSCVLSGLPSIYVGRR